MAVPAEVEIMAFSTPLVHGTMMNPIVMTPMNTVQLACLCLIPQAWATYFLDSKSPFDAWRMGCGLIATLNTAIQQDQALLLANWLQAACVKRGLGARDWRISCLGM
jgi:hypothetical protein